MRFPVTQRVAWLQERLEGITQVVLVHGQQSSEEKRSFMEQFSQVPSPCHVLVGTTVVEVGMNVPSATLMIIEHAERYGLSQLHQLRGRVGRSRLASRCLLLMSDSVPAKSEAAERLTFLEKCHDGFEIADRDLSYRGHGDIFGTKQSGAVDYRIAEVNDECSVFMY